MAATALRRFARGALRRAPAPVRGPLSRAAFGAYQRYRAFRAPREEQPSDGFPLPPPRLRVLVSGGADAGRFLRNGALEAAAMRGFLGAHSVPIEDMDAILDFGCGCGRVTRHWASLEGPDVHGCDYNPDLVRWCEENLPFMTAKVNQGAPPLPFERQFDFIYAISVFTHLSEPLQFEWIEELRRARAPGGVLLFTTVGARGRERLTSSEREAFDRGELVVRFDESTGSNLCAVFHPPAYVDRMIDGLELLETVDTGLPGVKFQSPLSHQDVHLVRKSVDG